MFDSQLLGSIITCTATGLIASLGIILLVHRYVKFKIFLAIPNRECNCILW